MRELLAFAVCRYKKTDVFLSTIESLSKCCWVQSGRPRSWTVLRVHWSQRRRGVSTVQSEVYVVASGRRSSNRNFAAAEAPKYDLVVFRKPLTETSTSSCSWTLNKIVAAAIPMLVCCDYCCCCFAALLVHFRLPYLVIELYRDCCRDCCYRRCMLTLSDIIV